MASFELKEIAENGNLAPRIESLSDNKRVSDVVVGEAPLTPQSSVTLEITADRGARFLSFVSMMICTNDGFTGRAALPLPRKVGHTLTFRSLGFDAGTEINTVSI